MSREPLILEVDWKCVADYLLRDGHGREMLPGSALALESGFLLAPNGEIGLLASNILISVPLIPQQPIYYGGRPYIQYGRPKPTQVTIGHLMGPKAVFVAFLARFGNVADIQTLTIEMRNGENEMTERLHLRLALVMQVGMSVAADAMSTAESVRIESYALPLWS